MDELISRQAAIDALKQQADTMSEWSERYAEQRRGVLTAVNIVEDLPPAQPEIIRCKDCKFWTHIKRTNRYWCKTDDGLYDLNPSPNDYCSRAERRTDEHSD